MLVREYGNDYIHGSHHDGLDHALSQLIPLINELDFESLVNDISCLSPLQTQFYLSYLNKRRELIFVDRARMNSEIEAKKNATENFGWGGRAGEAQNCNR